MKHLAIPSMSTWRNIPYTTPGLGDRVHTILICYNYSIAHKTPVTIHLTDDKWNWSKGQRNDLKIKSWNEILSLLPNKTIEIQAHPVAGLSNSAWVKYLCDKNINAESYHYGDFTGKYEDRTTLDISPYASMYPCIAPVIDIDLPDKFITSQFDSSGIASIIQNSDKRKIAYARIQSIKSKFEKEGYEIITLGGEATDNRFKELKYCGAALAKARYHIGADSGFLHLASLYKKAADIQICVNKTKSHHVLRAEKNGAKVLML